MCLCHSHINFIKSVLCPSAYIDMDSNTVYLAMSTKISIILAISTFASCDKICENEDGDLFWIDNPVVNYTVTDPENSPMGKFIQKLEVDDHNYTLLIRNDLLSVKYNTTNKNARAYYKVNFKSTDEIEFSKEIMEQLSRLYGYKDFDLQRTLGYQKRKVKIINLKNTTCYHYRCNATVNNVNCNLTPNTTGCAKHDPISANPSYFVPANGENVYFLGQCVMQLANVRGNMFNIWLGTAFRKDLPIIKVLESSVKLDWKINANTFPKGKKT